MKYRPREYRVVKLLVAARAVFLVVAEDLADPDVWAVITTADTAHEGWCYVSEIQARNRVLAREAGCRA